MTKIHFTGTLIKNFVHCRRQAYLYYYGLNFRNDLVRIGEVMHEEQNPKEYVFEKIKVDDIKGDFIIEYKKTSSNLEGTRMQVLHYLAFFHEHGLPLKAKIIDLTYKKEYLIEWSESAKKELEKLKEDLSNTLNSAIPERKKLKKECKGCSFKDYCWSI